MPNPKDAELIAELEAAGVEFMAFRGGLRGDREVWTTTGSQDARKIAAGMRAAIVKWGHLPQHAISDDEVASASGGNPDIANQSSHKAPDLLSDFQDNQWWVQELNKVYSAHKTIAVTPDLKRAVAVVHNLLRAVRETEVVGKATRTATRPKAINRYCHANMCLDKDAQHERDCPKALKQGGA